MGVKGRNVGKRQSFKLIAKQNRNRQSSQDSLAELKKEIVDKRVLVSTNSNER